MMNAKRCGFSVLGGWLVLSAVAHAQVEVGHAMQMAAVSVTQSSSREARRQSDELLKKARQAMQEGQLKTAWQLLEEAEALDVQYDGLLQRFLDTPAKLRRDLQRTQGAPDDAPDAGGRADTQRGEPAEVITKPSDPSRGGERSTQPATRGPANAPSTTSPSAMSRNAAKLQTLQLLSLSRAALARGEIAQAERFARQADSIGLADEEFAEGEPRPWMLLLEIDRAKRQAGQSVRVDRAVRPAAALQGPDTRQFAQQPVPEAPNLQSPPSAPTPARPRSQPTEGTAGTPVEQLLRAGEDAVRARDFDTARSRFREAWKYEAQLDPTTRQRLQDNLQMLRVAATAAAPAGDDLTEGERQLARRFSAEISRERVALERRLQQQPRQAWQQMQQLRQRVADAELPESVRRQLLAGVDRSLKQAEAYIEQNRARIELDEQNRDVLADIARRRQHRVQVDEQLATMVDEFNSLMDQERFSEAVIVARKARELDPNNPVVGSMVWKSRFAERLMVDMSLRQRSQMGVESSLSSVVESGIPFDDRIGIEFPEGNSARYWADLTSRRQRAMRESGRQMTDTELQIQQALRQKVKVRFDETPLSDVLNQLGEIAGISIYLDPQGLAAEGTTSNMPVTIQLNQELQLKSALNLILEQFGLTFVIQDEVLKITSKSIRDSKVYVQTYDVADLVIPIPNFTPGYNMGLPNAIREGYQAQRMGPSFQAGYQQAPLNVLAEDGQTPANGAQPSVLAQLASSGQLPANGGSQAPGFGPGGMGGGAQADFDTLIDLIVNTIAPDTWTEVGGEGSIEGFPTNLSLVISQTQEVHEQIADLLEQLRRLQDLQVTIEVRFITLNDNFFERIGVDFDFDIDDNVTNVPADDDGPSVTIGLDPQGNPTADLDLSFTQDSFGSAVPAFGGFDAATAANFGFAILSDIEAFFLIQAAQGDNRTNVLQAPKVTLFNGQQASVNDTSSRPFVTSVTPVVGDFAAAQAPIIVVLSEGTQLNVQAVVSPDRRFVRLTLVPFFSKIGDVEEFTFEGRRTSRTGTAVTDPTDETSTLSNDAEEVVEGTTVQLPQFAFTSVSTTVSVPDGGTILLGGIKRLSEGRNERGVPLLSKFPYVNRLFKNVGIGRTTQSLMMMVTPRIIIQEEEEEKLGIALPGS